MLLVVPPSDMGSPMVVSSAAVGRAELEEELLSTGTLPTSCR